MPSGAAVHQGEKGADTAGVGAGGGAKGTDVCGIAAVGQAGAPGAGKTFSRTRAGTETAVHPAAAVPHGRLAAEAAAARAGAAARSGQEIAGSIAVLEAAAPIERETRGAGELI